MEKEFYMWRFVAIVLLGTAALAAGCKPPPAPPAPKPAEPPAEKNIVAVEPRDGAHEVLLTPTFKWKLPAAVGTPRLVSFTLFELGQGAEPPKPRDKDKEIAFASGLHDVSPTALDPSHPPAGVVLTGELRDLKEADRRLKPETWYRWRIRALGENNAVIQADFFFRTGEAGPTPAK
jgi:hypothetical protein